MLFFTDKERVLIEKVCFCPVRIFTKEALEIAISCWEWLLVARKNLEDEASSEPLTKYSFAVLNLSLI